MSPNIDPTMTDLPTPPPRIGWPHWLAVGLFCGLVGWGIGPQLWAQIRPALSAQSPPVGVEAAPSHRTTAIGSDTPSASGTGQTAGQPGAQSDSRGPHAWTPDDPADPQIQQAVDDAIAHSQVSFFPVSHEDTSGSVGEGGWYRDIAQQQIAQLLDRIVNADVGDWVPIQRGEQDEWWRPFADVLSPDMIAKCGPTISYACTPFMADVDGDRWGGVPWPADGPVWFGQVTNVQMGTESYGDLVGVNVQAQVVYTHSQDSSLTRDATIHLVLTPDIGGVQLVSGSLTLTP